MCISPFAVATTKYEVEYYIKKVDLFSSQVLRLNVLGQAASSQFLVKLLAVTQHDKGLMTGQLCRGRDHMMIR